MTEFDLFPNTLEPVRVTPGMKKSWSGISKWAIFFSVIGFIGVLFGILGFFISVISLVTAPAYERIGFYRLFMLLLSGFMVGISLAANVFHIKFAMNIQSSVHSENQRVFESAWRSFRNYFRLQGIFMILAASLVIIMIYYLTYNTPYRYMNY